MIEPIRELAQIWRPWLQDSTGFGPDGQGSAADVGLAERHGIPHHELHMREEGDYRQDFIVKSEFLDAILAEGNEIVFVVDDRPSVVAMWRERGLTCLQCRDWDEAPVDRRPADADGWPFRGREIDWLASEAAQVFGIHPSHVLSSDQIRADLCGDFRDQTRNDEVFATLHAVAKARLSHGLPTVIDATNLRRKDRMEAAGLAKGGKVRYLVIDRPMDEKIRDAGWRATLPFDLLAKHQQTFGSQIKDILAGDRLPNVEVIDLRRAA